MHFLKTKIYEHENVFMHREMTRSKCISVVTYLCHADQKLFILPFKQYCNISNRFITDLCYKRIILDQIIYCTKNIRVWYHNGIFLVIIFLMLIILKNIEVNISWHW